MRLTIQCPLCEEGTLTAQVSPDSLEDMTDDGCGHAARLWGSREIHDALDRAIAAAEEDAYLDAQEARYERWSDT